MSWAGSMSILVNRFSLQSMASKLLRKFGLLWQPNLPLPFSLMSHIWSTSFKLSGRAPSPVLNTWRMFNPGPINLLLLGNLLMMRISFPTSLMDSTPPLMPLSHSSPWLQSTKLPPSQISKMNYFLMKCCSINSRKLHEMAATLH
jgi:hypothetical protein